MEPWYSVVIGTVAFFYVHSFNRNAKLYFQNEKNLGWSDFFKVIIPVIGDPNVNGRVQYKENGGDGRPYPSVPVDYQ